MCSCLINTFRPSLFRPSSKIPVLVKKIAKRPISKSGKDKKNEKTHLCNGGVLECGSKKDDNLPKKNGTEKNYVVSQPFCYIFNHDFEIWIAHYFISEWKGSYINDVTPNINSFTLPLPFSLSYALKFSLNPRFCYLLSSGCLYFHTKLCFFDILVYSCVNKAKRL